MTNQNPRHKWYVLGFGAVINMVVFAMSSSAMPVLFKEISDELNLNVVQLGTVWGASAVAGIFSIITAGFLADRFGAKRVLAVFCLAAAIFGASRGLANNFFSLSITSLLFGMAAEAVPVIVIKNASLWFRDRGLGTAQGIITAFVGGGLMLGAMFSATVFSPWLGGWRNVMFLYGAVSALVGLAWYLATPAPPDTHVSGVPAPHSIKPVFRVKGVWFIAIAMLGFAGGNRGVMGYLPLYLRGAGWSPVGADGALAALSAAGTAGAVPLTLLSDRIGRRKGVIVAGLVSTIIGVSLLSLITGPAAWLLVILSGLFRDLVWAAAATMTVETEGVGPEYAGTAVGLVHSFARIGYTVAPPAGNALVVFGAGMPFVLWAGFSAAALVAFLMVKEKGYRKITANQPR